MDKIIIMQEDISAMLEENVWFNNPAWKIFRNERIFGNPYNKIWIEGVVDTDVKYDTEISAFGVYTTTIRVARLSKNEDLIPVVIPREVMKNLLPDAIKGKFVRIYGQTQMQNYVGYDGKTHVRIYVYARTFSVYANQSFSRKDYMSVAYLEGNICKKPYTREKSTNNETNTTFVLAVRRDSSKSEFIHCIAWKTTSDYAKKLSVGDRVRIMGILHSRNYFKKNGESGTAYEISVFKLEKLEKRIY